MPNYEYECQHCKHVLEVHQSFDEAPLTLCPECSHNALLRCISVPLLVKSDTPRTIGTLAERNSKYLNSDEKNRIAEETKTRKEVAPRIPLPPAQQPTTKGKKPWYKKFATATGRELNKMTPAQTHKYIMTGEKS